MNTRGVAKSRFRRIKMSEKLNKKSKEDFVANVKKCLSTEKALRPYNIRRFSRRARSYMLLYYALNKQQRQEYRDISENQDAAIVPTECKDFHSIQKMVKTFLTHRNIVDLETGYINRVMRGEEIKEIVVLSSDGDENNFACILCKCSDRRLVHTASFISRELHY